LSVEVGTGPTRQVKAGSAKAVVVRIGQFGQRQSRLVQARQLGYRRFRWVEPWMGVAWHGTAVVVRPGNARHVESLFGEAVLVWLVVMRRFVEGNRGAWQSGPIMVRLVAALRAKVGHGSLGQSSLG
jgi:hypothetical protein